MAIIEIEKTITFCELRELTNFSREFVQKHIDAGTLKYIDVSGGQLRPRYKFLPSEVARWMRSILKG